MPAIYWWVMGDDLASAVRSADLPPGDWVRWCRQVIDALGQIASSASEPLRTNAHTAADSIRRSVVALAEGSA